MDTRRGIMDTGGNRVAERPDWIYLGFDAVIESIDASQTSQDSILPHLPAELICKIVNHVPVDYVLSWRLVCRAVRDYVDGPLLYRYIQRAVLIGYFDTSQFEEAVTDGSFGLDYFLRAPFERLEAPIAPNQDCSERGAGRETDYAVFRIDPSWTHTLFTLLDTVRDTPLEQFVKKSLRRLEMTEDEECFGTLRWCIRLDKAVGELDFPIEAAKDSLTVDFTNGRVVFKWKELLFQFLKTETSFRKMMQEKQDGRIVSYFDDLPDHCLRAIRRQRLNAALDNAALDLSDGAHRRIKWEMNRLRPLFEEPHYDRAAPSVDHLGPAENEAIGILYYLRKEAAMKPKELAHLRKLAESRKILERDLGRLLHSVKTWSETLTGQSLMSYDLDGSPFYVRGLTYDPFGWGEGQRMRVEALVLKWNAQKSAVEKVNNILEASREAMNSADDALVTLNSDAFDQLNSDI